MAQFMIGIKILFTIVILLLYGVLQSSTLKIAIVGGGIGGASSAFHLRELYGSDVSIQMFDGGPIGGRIHSADIHGKHFESGASIIHVRNRYMRKFANLLNLTDCKMDEESVLSVFNGVKPAFIGSEWSWWQTTKLFWRYGPDLIRIQSIVSEMLNQFDEIYQMHTDGKAFADLENLIATWNKNFPPLLNQSLADVLRSKGISERFIDELANAAARNNYNQRASDIHGFVGLVSMAGFLPGLFCIEGGNELVVRKLLKLVNVNVTTTWVSSIEESSGTLKNPKYALHLNDGRTLEGFDFIILAAPRYQNALVSWPQFMNVEPNLPPIERTPYQPVVATFVNGQLNTKYFRLPEGNQDYAIFMSGRASTDPVNSIAVHVASDDCNKEKKSKIWKVFSAGTEPLTPQMMEKLFAKHSYKKVVSWRGAYPRYSIPTRTRGLRFTIAPGLICLYPIEQLASAMEMSAIAGANAALLVKHYHGSTSEKIRGSPGRGRHETGDSGHRISDEL